MLHIKFTGQEGVTVLDADKVETDGMGWLTASKQGELVGKFAQSSVQGWWLSNSASKPVRS
jgi:hypothetical protein